MRRLLIMTLVLVLGAGLAQAQDVRLGVFADNAGTNCAVTDAAPGLLPVYVVLINATGATGAQYKATKPECMATASYLSDTNPFGVVIGNSQTGVAVAFGACLSANVHVQTMNFFAAGTTPTCCIYPIACDPNAGLPDCALKRVTMTDCEFVKISIRAQSGVVNANASCACALIVDDRDSSWGQIKALYSE